MRYVSIVLGAGLLALAVTAAAILPSPSNLALFVVIFAIFVSPGWPLARWFGGSTLDGCARAILAVLLGYLAGATMYMVMRLCGLAVPWLVLAACLVLAGALHVLLRGPQPGVVAFSSLAAPDRAGLGALLLITAAIVGPVFARIGQATPSGLAYRAYFIADLFAHMSVVGELVHGVTPPVNPYLPGESLPYYWAYFALPTLFSQLTPGLLVDRGILLTDVVAAAVFVSVGFLVARSLGASTRAAVVGWVVVLVASSFEGIYFLMLQWMRGRSGDAFRFVNIDAITRWFWDAPPTDGLHRMMWYTPQHEMAVTMGLLVFASLVLARDRNSRQRGIADGLLLGGAFAFSSFNGIVLTAWFAGSEIGLLLGDRARGLGRWLSARTVSAVVVLGFVALMVALGMLQNTPGATMFRWNRFFQRAPWAFLLLSFGPALFLAPFGIRTMWQRRRAAVVALGILILTCIGPFLFFEVRGHENTYIPFRLGQLFFITLAFLLMFAIDAWRQWRPVARRAAWALLIVASLAAMPTVVLDWYNARDISNVEMNPGGFPWTVYIDADDLQALHWIGRNVAATATVQTDAHARGRATWALIPAFAGRHMAIGFGLFQPNPTRFREAIERVRGIYRTPDAAVAHASCRQLGIDYLYVGAVETSANRGGVGKFENAPTRFQRVYRHGSVQIFRIIR